MSAGFKWVLVGLIAFAFGLTGEAGARTVQGGPGQVEIVGPTASTALAGKKGKKHKKRKKHKKGHKKAKGHKNGKKGKKGK